MFRVTSLTKMPEAQLNRWIKRIALLFFVGLVAFVAFYAIDRFRVSPAPDRRPGARRARGGGPGRSRPTSSSRGQLADLYFAKGRFDDAIAQYTALIDAEQGGRAREPRPRPRPTRSSGSYDEAIPDYEKVVEIAADRRDGRASTRCLAAGYYGLGTIAHGPGPAAGRDRPAHARRSRSSGPTPTSCTPSAPPTSPTDQPEQGDRARSTLAIALVPVGWAEPYAALETAYTQARRDRPRRVGRRDGRRSPPATPPAPRSASWRSRTASRPSRPPSASGSSRRPTGDTAAAADWYRKALAHRPRRTSPPQLGLGRVTAGQPPARPSPAEGSN